MTEPYGTGGSLALPRVSRRETLTDICREIGAVVYFIRTDDDLIKIGHTTDLAARKRHFGSGWQHILAIVPGSREDERDLHRRFAEHLARGREYFHAVPELLDHIDALRARLGVSPVRR